ncbi:NosD domain-containing protein [Terracidiphilus gabretensis]|uniref:NosD domain-containing protein n=1 Tax=Terracidiphilus gabretensis TaxID=1577687 RepID=UPI0012FC6224|nr:NosD domain-containing protein [Terracidiphilus gabretensis]
MTKRWAAVCAAFGLALTASGCGSEMAAMPPTAPVTSYVLTVNSIDPASGAEITATPADANSQENGTTAFTRSYTAGTTVTLTATATAGGSNFSSWTGCTSTNGASCSVTMSANATVTANYVSPHTPTAYYVSGTGNDSADGLTTATAFLTLQHAANKTQPGDTVYVMNGTYTNSCVGCDVLDITTPGTASAWITFTALSGQTPKIQFNGWQGVHLLSTAAYIEVSGFAIEGNNYNVTLAGAQNQSTTNPDPAYNGNCIASDGRQGTATQRPHHLRILNNTIWACGGAGVGIIQSDYTTISGNTIYDTSWYSIYGSSAISTFQDWNSDNSTATKMVITGNRIFNNAQLIPTVGGTIITDGEGIIVDTNRNSSYDPTIGIPAYTGRTYIANNVIYGNGSAAIEAFQSDHVDVGYNSAYQDLTVRDVTGRGEMNVNAASDVNVVGNIFYAPSGQNPATVLSNTSAILLDYNLYYNGVLYPGTVSGPHDLTADPLYVDPADANRFNVLLAVQPASPAVGSGTSQLAPPTDFLNHPRPGPTGYDRGAYQQQ